MNVNIFNEFSKIYGTYLEFDINFPREALMYA